MSETLSERLAGVEQTAAILPIVRGLKAPRAAGVAGLLFSALFLAAMLLLRLHPPPGASAAEVTAFYERGDGNSITLVGLYLAPFAGLAFIWFLAVVRSHVGHRRDRFFDTVFIGSGLVFVAMLFAAAAAAGAVSVAVRFQDGTVPSASVVEVASALAYSLLFTFGIRAAAMFMLVTSAVGLRTGRLSHWFVYTTWVFAAALMLSVAFFQLVVLVFPLWVAAISILILASGRVPDGEDDEA